MDKPVTDLAPTAGAATPETELEVLPGAGMVLGYGVRRWLRRRV